MPKPPPTHLCTACCGSSTAGSWWASSAAWWARTATRCPPTASAARWTPWTTTTVWPESPELSLSLALKKKCIDSTPAEIARGRPEGLGGPRRAPRQRREEKNQRLALRAPPPTEAGPCTDPRGRRVTCRRGCAGMQKCGLSETLPDSLVLFCFFAKGLLRLFTGSVCLPRHRQGYTPHEVHKQYVHYCPRCIVYFAVTLTFHQKWSSSGVTEIKNP